MPSNGQTVNIQYYSRTAFNALSSKNTNTIYFVEESNGKIAIYVGASQANYIDAITKGMVEGVLTGPITTHTHSQYLTAITKAMVEGVLTGTITTHTHNASALVQNASNRLVTDTEKTTWNGKQNALGFTPENVANKRTYIRTSGATNTSYVSELGVKNYVDARETAITTYVDQGLNGKEDKSNKTTTVRQTGASDTLYPSEKAVSDAIASINTDGSTTSLYAVRYTVRTSTQAGNIPVYFILSGVSGLDGTITYGGFKSGFIDVITSNTVEIPVRGYRAKYYDTVDEREYYRILINKTAGTATLYARNVETGLDDNWTLNATITYNITVTKLM